MEGFEQFTYAIKSSIRNNHDIANLRYLQFTTSVKNIKK